MDKFQSAFISGLIELVVTHPIDYYKNLYQKQIANPINIIIKNPFVGLSPKIIGVIPMRLTFWITLDYCKSNHYSPYLIPLITSSLQTLIDYPLEQRKMNIIFKPQKLNYLKAFLPHYSRNLIFAYGFYNTTTRIENPFLGGALGGLIGSVISQPLDGLKTHYQSGNSTYPKWLIKDYYRGTVSRAIICLLSMSIGYGVFSFLK
jgi:hypothetical protein